LRLKKRQAAKNVVGFYKDKAGETHPVTKSTVEFNRKKVVQNPKQFSGVIPATKKPAVARVRDTAQELEDLLGELNMLRNNVLVFEEQRKQLLDRGSETMPIDREIARTKQRAALVKVRIRKLGS
jgi:hypothetical protein